MNSRAYAPRFEVLSRVLAKLRLWVAPVSAGERPEVQTSAYTRREVIDLAWPTAVAMLSDTFMGLIDTKLVAGLGSAALGGVGIATTIMWLNYSIVFGIMRGVKVRTAHALGQGRRDDGLAYARAGFLLAIVCGTLIWLLGRDATWLFVRLGIDPATIPYARDFLAARTFGAVSICVISAFVQYRQGLSDSRSPMVAGILANVVNAALAYALIYGRFGFPALGVRGAGYGTAIAETVEALFLGWIVLRDRAGRSAGNESVLRPMQAIREVCTLGVPTGLQFGMEMLAFTAFTAILGGLGTHEIAAHQIAMTVMRTSFLPGVAIAEAASVLVGTSLGARDLERADRITRTAIGLAAGFMSLCGLGFALFGGFIAAQFSTDPLVLVVVRRLLLVAALFQTCDAVTIVLRGALRGAKDVRVVMAIGISVAWLCIPGAAYFLGKGAGLGALGGWLGFIAETSIAATLFWLRWSRGSWRNDYASRTSVQSAPAMPSAAAA
jgi:multidrug resistance protein, MATE family